MKIEKIRRILTLSELLAFEFSMPVNAVLDALMSAKIISNDEFYKIINYYNNE